MRDLGMPDAIAGLLAGLHVGPAELSAGGTAIRRIGQPPRFFLKSGPEAGVDPPGVEARKLAWLRSQGIPCAPVVAFETVGSTGHLLTEALAGAAASSLGARLAVPSVLDALAEAVTALHALPIGACPFPAGVSRKLMEARYRFHAGLVDPAAFEPSNVSVTPTVLFERLAASVPEREDLVVVHGDLTLDNIVMDGDRVSGFIDVGRLGVTDRHCDVALICRSLRKAGPPGAADAFLDRYGRSHVDPTRMDWYLLLDEFF